MSHPEPDPKAAEIVAAEKTLSWSYINMGRAMSFMRREKKISNRLSRKGLPRNRPLKLKESLYTKGIFQNANNPLVQLPTEIKNAIFKELPLEADRSTLALTCKGMAAAHQELVKEKNKKDYVAYIPRRTTDSHRLQLLVRLKKDTPQKRLCYKCLQFIDVNLPENQGQWGGSEAAVQDLKATHKAMLEGPRCPLCIAADKMRLAKHKATYKEYLALADKFTLK